MESGQRKRRRSRSQGYRAPTGDEYPQEQHLNRMHLGAAMTDDGNINGNGDMGQQQDGWYVGQRDQHHRSMEYIDTKLDQNGYVGSFQEYAAPHFHPHVMMNETDRGPVSPWATGFAPPPQSNLPQYLSFAGPMHHHAPDPYGHHHAPQSLNYPGMPFNVAPPHMSLYARPQQQSEIAGWQPHPNAEHIRGESTLSGFHPDGPVYGSQNHHKFSVEDEPSLRPTKTKKTGRAEKNGKAASASSMTPGAKGFVACVPCRQRKIKCNGIRPNCTNCYSKHLECKYDEVVKRRGPDKQPGGRMRKRDVKKEDGQESPKPNADGSASTSRTTSANGEPESPSNSKVPSSNFTFTATLQATTGVVEASNVISPTGHQFQHISVDGVIGGGGVGVTTLPPAATFTEYSAKTSNSSHRTVNENDTSLLYTDGSIVVQAPSEPDVEFSWIAPSVQFNDPTVIPGQTQGAGTSPKLGVYGLLIPGDNMFGVANARNGATISPITDNNEESDASSTFQEEWTPPQLSLDLERVPNIAYARDQDWAWMAGLFSDRRDRGMIILDLRLREVFDMGLSWFGCINRSAFFAQLHHPVARLDIQPGLVLALLACNTLFRTGEDGPTHPGRQLACGYADAARAMIQQSVIANKTDPSLAQAALVLSIFETCPHPLHSLERSAAALKQMDAIMQMFCLFAIDVTDERVSIYLPNQVPKLSIDSATGDPTSGGILSPEIEKTVLAPEDQSSRHQAAMWSPVPKWPAHWTESDMRKDESRRVAWTASSVVAAFSAWSLAMGTPPLDLYSAQPENYAIFFPAEVMFLSDDQSEVPVGKRTMWALFHRVVLLWHFTVKLYHTSLPEDHKFSAALEILQEVDIIEKSLFESNEESGNLYRWQARDWIINIRKLTASGIRHKQGLVSASELVYDPMRARSWLATQNKIAISMAKSMSGGKSVGLPALKNRPMYVWWLLGQAKTACDFYEQDNSLTSAIELAGGMWKAIDMLVECWPCPSVKAVAAAFKNRYDRIVKKRNMQQAAALC